LHLEILNSIPQGILAFNKDGQIIYQNKIAMDKIDNNEILQNIDGLYQLARTALADFFENEEEHRNFVTSQIEMESNEKKLLAKCMGIYSHDYGKCVVIIFESQEMNQIHNELIDNKNDLQAIFDSLYDVIYVSDGEGNTLRVSSACEILWGRKEEQLVKRNVNELELEGLFNPSITRLVQEQGKKVSAIQTTKTGRRLLVIGTPIKDETGKIVRIVNVSRDITEVDNLQSELENMREMTERYRKELLILKSKTLELNQFVYRSAEMDKVFSLVKKVAEVQSSVLINGETGVGKEVITNLIHELSYRKNMPLIKINCAAIPESLMESELFGYEKGAYTGANKEGKVGFIQLAHKGTLFLDEIGDLPLHLQVKLLRVLQEKKITRLGGTKEIDVDIRVISATNKNLEKEVEEGKFRSDLYYRLNVIPIFIPPLRKRREDIVPLISHFQEKLNSIYMKNMRFSTSALDVLQAYDWNGNVRELQNIIERLIVTSDSELIDVAQLPVFIRESKQMNSSPEINEIMSMKDAVEKTEEKLLTMAYDKYKTTVAISKALSLDQSTVSRKLKKYGMNIYEK
jgi:PAS domain S-box-containing protein